MPKKKITKPKTPKPKPTVKPGAKIRGKGWGITFQGVYGTFISFDEDNTAVLGEQMADTRWMAMHENKHEFFIHESHFVLLNEDCDDVDEHDGTFDEND